MVTITRRNNLLLLSPWKQELAEPLSFKRRIKQDTWPFKVVYRKEKLYTKNEDNSAFTYGGFFKRIIRTLGTYRIPYTVVDERDPLPSPQFDRLGSLREKQDIVLASMCASYGGVVKCPTGWGKSFLICQLARMYPGSKILVLTPKQPVVKSLYKRLCDAEATESNKLKISAVYAGKRYMPDSDIIVCSSLSVHKIDSEWPDLVIFDEVHGAGTTRLLSDITEFAASRMFGFSATPEGRHDNADLQIEALFGEVICNIAYTTAQADGTVPAVQVRLVRVTGPSITYTTDVDKDRQGYWCNTVRNEKIAESARSHDIKDRQTLILVKTVEHAFILKNLLPEFTLVHGPIDQGRVRQLIKLGVLSTAKYSTQEAALAYQEYVARFAPTPETRVKQTYADFLVDRIHKAIGKVNISAMDEAFRIGEIKKVIATTVWREGVDFPDLSVVIRADGMSGVIASLQMAGRLCRISEQQKILIDFTDEFGDTFERRYMARLKHYKTQGWEMMHDWTP